VSIQLFMVVSIVFDFILILFLMWLNRKVFFDIYISISRKSKILLFLIVAVFSIVVAINGFNFKVFIPSDEEWELLRQAKELLSGGQVFHYLRYGIVYPTLLAFGFLLFGVNPLVASVMNFVFGIMSIFLLFTITQLLFKNEKISLISALIYAFSPLFYIFTTLQMGFPSTVNFFLLLFVLVSVLSFQKHKVSLYALSLILIAVTAQIKPEYFVLIVPYGLCFLFFKEYLHIRMPNILFLIILFIFICAPYFIQNTIFKESYNSGWCSAFSMVGNTPVYSHLITEYVDPVIKKLINNRFSINYFIYKIPSFFQFWFFRSLAFITPLFILGIVSAAKKHIRFTIYLLSIFFSITLVYLADCPVYDTRYVFPTFGLVIIFFGVGINFLINFIDGRGNGNSLIKKVLLILFSLLMISCLYIYEFKNNLFEGNYRDYVWVGRNASEIGNIIVDLDKLIVDINNNSAILVVPNSSEENYLRIKGYKAFALSNIEALNTNNIGTEYKKVTLPFDKEKYVYFLELSSCGYDMLSKRCNYIKDNYNLVLLKQEGESGRLFAISAK